jgi:hypothetical protein
MFSTRVRLSGMLAWPGPGLTVTTRKIAAGVSGEAASCV